MRQALRIGLFAAYIVWLWSLEKVSNVLSACVVPLLRLFRVTRYAGFLAGNRARKQQIACLSLPPICSKKVHTRVASVCWFETVFCLLEPFSWWDGELACKVDCIFLAPTIPVTKRKTSTVPVVFSKRKIGVFSSKSVYGGIYAKCAGGGESDWIYTVLEESVFFYEYGATFLYLWESACMFGVFEMLVTHGCDTSRYFFGVFFLC